VGGLPLVCQISVAGYARPGLRADGAALRCPAASYALHAPAAVRAPGAARDALPSWDGTVEAAPARTLTRRIIRNLVSRGRQLLSEPLLLRRDHFRVGAAGFWLAFLS